jgi:hypothetical protein
MKHPNITCYITGIYDIKCYEGILYIMLYTMSCNMIHNVLHNMLRAKNPPSHFPLPGSGSASLQCPFIKKLLVGLALIIGEGHAPFLAGHIGSGGGAVRGAQRRSAGLDSSGGPVVLGWILGVPGEHLARNILHAGPCRLCRGLHPASPWRRRPCTRSQAWHQPWDPESP